MSLLLSLFGIAFVRTELVCVCECVVKVTVSVITLVCILALLGRCFWSLHGELECLFFSRCREPPPPPLHFNICAASHRKKKKKKKRRSLIRILPSSSANPLVFPKSAVPMHFTFSATHLTQQ